MCKIPPFVHCSVDIPYFTGVREFFCSYSHSCCKMGVHEVVGGSGIYQSFFVAHCVTCANRNWNTHRSIASDIHRVTFESCHVLFCGLPLQYYVDRRGHLLSCYDYAGKQYLVMDWHQSAVTLWISKPDNYL